MDASLSDATSPDSGPPPDPVPECPTAEPGGPICVNGWVRYLVDPEDPSQVLHSLVRLPSPTLKVMVYDPLAYATNPNVPPLSTGEVDHEEGTFRVQGIQVPSTGFIAVVVEDEDGGAADGFLLTGMNYRGAPGVNLEHVNAIAVSTAQIRQWTDAIGQDGLDSAGCTSFLGENRLFECGVWVGVYALGDLNGSLSFINGVQPQKFPGPTVIAPEKVFYLGEDYISFESPVSDVDNRTRSNGIAFHPGSRLGNYTGICAAGSSCEAAGYAWDQGTGTTGGATPRSVFVQILRPLGHE